MISADAMQVYRYMEIGTAKPSIELSNKERVMKSRWSIALLSTVLVLSAPGALGYAGPVRKKIAINASKIITISAADIQDGTILVEDGIIKVVGKDLDIPWDAFVIEATGPAR